MDTPHPTDKLADTLIEFCALGDSQKGDLIRWALKNAYLDGNLAGIKSCYPSTTEGAGD
jgi:hypothetical protein